MPYTNDSCLGGYEYPYNNSTQPNLDWMLAKILELETRQAAQAAEIADLQRRVTALESK